MPIDKKPFGTTKDGKSVDAYTLSNGQLSATVITFGGHLTHLYTPDKNGNTADIVLSFDNLADFEVPGPYFGALIGRVANRIAKGTFTLDGKTYHVPINNGPNSLHGGPLGYDKRLWSAETADTADGPALKLSLIDPNGMEGYPGTVHVTVTYTLTPTALRLLYEATTDNPTPINLTNHAYFNLKDAGKTDILSHIMQAEAEFYTPVDDTLIPTGKIAPVKGTPIDFTTPKPIGKDLLAMGGNPPGYDHNLVLKSNTGALARAATVSEPTTGRTMEVWTTQPGLQFYTGNFLDGVKGKGGTIYNRHSAFCLETQHFPDSVNHPNFPNTILRPGQKFSQTTEFRFGKR